MSGTAARTPPLQQRLLAQYRTALALAGSLSLHEAAPKILEAIGGALGWQHASVWIPDEDARVLRCAGTWQSPSDPLPEFESATRAMTYARGAGLPGQAWATGRVLWIPDVVRHTNFPRREVAAHVGLHAGLCFPITLGEEVFGVMEFFTREVLDRDEELLQTLATVGSQVGQFIERQRAEAELERFFDLSLDMLCVAGFDGRFKRLNHAWQKALGYTPEELMARPYVEFVHPDDREATAHEAGQIGGGTESLSFENRYRRKDGTYCWLQWNATPVAGQQLIYAVARDVTAQKQAQEKLRQYARELEQAREAQEENNARLAQLVRELREATARAQEATNAKSDFLARMSHEIRTPMNAVIGMTELALQTPHSPEQREYITTVRDSAESLMFLLNDILDFSKVEARQLHLERARFVLRDTIEEALKVFALRAADKGIELICDIRPEVPEALYGDSARLRQVVVNLVSNALKFTARGEIVLRVQHDAASAADVRTPQGPDAVPDAGSAVLRFSVVDTGIGIPADKQRAIFEAFAQADASTTRLYGGTGLGLAIARQLVALMNGRIWVESRPGKGSAFHFTATFGADPVPAPRPARATPGELRVLIVDDNATNRRILRGILASWRMRGTAVPSAAAAWKALVRARAAHTPYAAVLLDGHMPRVDGFELAARIKATPRLAATPLVLLTSAGRQEDIERCRKLGVAGYLMKPVRQSALLELIQAVIPGAPVKTGEARRSRRAPPLQPGQTPAAASGQGRPLRILLAEDNAVNRKLAVALLERHGHRVTVAANGRDAVAAYRKRGAVFDAILMDVRMPVMDGVEATAAIRAVEDGRRVPIVAMTAHVMKGDRERLIESGMDGYVPKPVRESELLEALAQAVRQSPARAAPAGASDGSGVLDASVLLARVGGDRKLLRDMVRLFIRDLPKLKARLARAMANADAREVAESAHAIKGASGTFSTAGAYEVAAKLEKLARSGKLDGVAGLARPLAGELDALEQSLNDIAGARATAGRKRT